MGGGGKRTGKNFLLEKIIENIKAKNSNKNIPHTEKDKITKFVKTSFLFVKTKINKEGGYKNSNPEKINKH